MSPRVWGAVAILAIGFVLGIQLGTPETKTRVVHDHNVRTITKTVTEYKTPNSCIKAAGYAMQMSSAAAKIDDTKALLFDVMSDLRIAVAAGNSNAANTLETRLRKIDGTTLDSVELIAELKGSFKKAIAECKNGEQ